LAVPVSGIASISITPLLISGPIVAEKSKFCWSLSAAKVTATVNGALKTKSRSLRMMGVTVAPCAAPYGS